MIMSDFVNFNNLIFYDVNPYQIFIYKIQIEILKLSSDLTDFIQNLHGKKISNEIKNNNQSV